MSPECELYFDRVVGRGKARPPVLLSYFGRIHTSPAGYFSYTVYGISLRGKPCRQMRNRVREDLPRPFTR